VCAAPIATGSGEGRLDYIIPGALGMLSGGLLFGLTYNSVYLQINKIAEESRVVLPDVIDTNHWLVIALFVAITLVLFYALDRAIKLRVNKAQ
jgi:hypothetical protein